MATEGTHPAALYEQNIKLQEEIDELKRTAGTDTRNVINRTPSCNTICTTFVKKTLLKALAIVLVATCVLTVYLVTEKRQESALQSLVTAVSSPKAAMSGVSGGSLPFGAQNVGGAGMGQDYRLNNCQGFRSKEYFPDVGYSLLGYNVLKGFPLANRHDPGFTYPIFRHDYTSGGMTADCRYSVPRGLMIIPDVSCVTSFSSIVIQTKYEFSKALSVSASVSGGGWGVSFSASTGYKESSSEISSGESVYIMSSANCNYYFSKLITEEVPQFDSVFIKWIHKLNETDLDPKLYFEFFETYGTHFPTEVTFGARYTYEHKMSSSKYESERKSGVNVAVQASYSGLFSVGASFNLDSEQRQAASNFSKSVETKTITVGAAPPANGDAMIWASEVKASPVPTAYELSSIELLFTDRYMKNLNVNYERIRNNIETKKHEYCLYLLRQGKIESCDSLVAGIELVKTRLFGHYKEMQVALSTKCIEKCLDEIQCVAVTFCHICTVDSYSYNTCYMYSEIEYQTYAEHTETEDSIWQSNIFPEKLRSQIEFNNTAIVGVPRGYENDRDKNASLEECHLLCLKDAHCVAYTHCDCPKNIVKCNMYSKGRISGLENEPDTKSFFISSHQNILKSTPASTFSESTASNATQGISV